MFKISLSAGHGKDTPGKRVPDNSMHEWEFNGAVVSEMVKLFSCYKDVSVKRLDDPTGKKDVALSERAAGSNGFGADFHLDVHANAAGDAWSDANGIETFAYDLKGTGYKIAVKLQKALIAATGLKDRGVKDGSHLYMINKPHAPANLVECGFMSNKKEAALLKSDDYRKKIASALVGAIAEHFNLVEEVRPQPIKAPEKEVQKTKVIIKTGWFSEDSVRLKELESYLKSKGCKYTKEEVK